ncbi:MAG: DUF4019 domain-containing protein [Desulfobacterales bacterium]|jgi:hypothetical protein
MWRTKIITVIGMVVLVLCSSSLALAVEAKEAAALEAAKTWLTLVDNGHYGESWETAAAYFKSTVTKDYWQQAINAVRKLFGEPLSRKLGSITYTQSLPGAPDGEYVVIEIATSFEKKKHAVETVIPMLDSDGEWRVSGYFIK